MTESFDVFLSHNREDKPIVRRVAKALSEAGIKVWFDEWNLKPGISWQSALEDAIMNSRAVLVFIGQKEFGPWQQQEMYSALSFATHERRPVIPVMLPDAKPAELPLFFRDMTYVRIKSLADEDFKPALRQIIWGITGRLRTLPEQKKIPRVFLCHAKEDDEIVRNLYFRLRDFDIDPWYDKEKLTIGDRWEQEIIRAIENTDFFAICLSKKSITKKGFIQREIKLAIKEYQRRPQQFAYLLPVRLEPCEIPNIQLDVVTALSDFQWMDLFEKEEDSLQRFAEGVRKQFEAITKSSA